MKINVKKLYPDALVPQRQSEGAAGLDLHAYLPKGGRTMYLRDSCLIGTGVSMAIPRGWEGQIRPRSGLALKYGITVLNSPGTVDSDYRGEIKVMLHNQQSAFYRIKNGDRIAQLVLAPVGQAELVLVDELDDTVRGTGGFGHTG